MSRHGAALVLLLPITQLATTCGSTGPGDTGPEGTETTGDDVGLRHFTGGATVVPSERYTGWEAFHFTDERGQGEDLCRVRYDLVSLGARTDCPDCTWAFDLEARGAAVEPRGDPGCEELGITAMEFEGAQYAYGFAASTGAYQDVLMYQVGGYGWYPVSWASWDDPDFSYDWPMNYYYF